MSTEPFVLPPAPEIWTPEPSFDRDAEQQSDAAWLDGHIHHFSATSISMLKICPEQYRQRYILGRKERPGEALTMGNAVHDALAFTHEQKIESHEDLPVPVVVEYYHDKSWPEAVESDGGESEIRWDKKPEEVRHDGQRVTQAYHTVVSPRVQPIAVEQKFSVVVDGVPVPFIGYLDVEEEFNVVDVKTGKQEQKKPDAKWRFQGTLYTIVKNKATHFHSVSRAQTPSIATPKESPEMIVQPDPRQIAPVEKVLRDFAWQVEQYFNRYGPDEAWPTTGAFMDYRGGPACNFCGFRKFCDYWVHEREVPTDMVNLDGTPITMPV
jgi:CRISPR/Cas system-associated exonuclease Cas4 (RecB family)